ncbi:glycoside hydrolase family 15 protein [Haloarcula halophila]|uniref:glycoside hydrolase family 15 protein n=1 Tax=Haloarcula TaxID=2237 RepID=UPI0023E44469|nr:glycoside hydrolase family 15 protein [Halomicroarcula sp. DFY41]
MTRRREFVRFATGIGMAGLAGCPGRFGGGESTATDTGTATETAIEAPSPTWTTGRKFGVATVPDHGDDAPSRVWATFTEGAVTEVRYPRVDLLNLRTLEFVVVDTEDRRAWRSHRTDRTTTDSVERSTTLATDRALVYEQTFAPTESDAWELTAEWVTDPQRDALLGRVDFDGAGRHEVYAVARTACSQSAGADFGRRVPTADGYQLAAWDTDGNDGQHVVRDDGDSYEVALGMVAESGFSRAGALEPDDGQALLEAGEWTNNASVEGVVDLAGRLLTGSGRATLALGFATDRDQEAARETARAAVDAGYERAREAYVSAWEAYLGELSVPDSVAGDDELAIQYRVAAMVLAAVEDKTYVGAGIASPSVPWGTAVGASTPSDYGYNFVWARDLYQSFTALRAMGDVDGARRAVEYVFEYQQREDGAIPQNTFVDGRLRWGGEQLDEVALPLVMASQLADRHGLGFDAVEYSYDQVKAAADYVAGSGPATGQERWEEESGYSPSTIAAEIAGLTCAAALAAAEDERADALVWLATADEWARSVEAWCATTTGADGNEPPYYMRVDDDTDPDDGADLALANGGPTLDERAVIDAGFLELVRLGIVSADDPVIRNSVSVVDGTIRRDTPNGPAWYRYNGDGYGEAADGSPWQSEGQGRLWPILTGERGEYELRRGTDSGELSPRTLLSTMAGFANEGRMIPEQVWDRDEPTEYGWAFGEGTGSATPLSWSMAQYVRLAHGIDAGEPVETPAIVAERFGTERSRPSLTVGEFPTTTEESTLSVAVTTDAAELIVRHGQETRRIEPDGERLTVEVPLSGIRNTVTFVAADDTEDIVDAAVALERRTVTYRGE